jgi:hypothetical protein
MMGLTRSGDTSAVPASSATFVTILTPTQSPEIRESMKPCRPRSRMSWTLPGKMVGMSASYSATSEWLGRVEDLDTGSSPARASTPPFFPTPA